MKQKINLFYILISVGAILLTVAATTVVDYSFLKQEMLENLKIYAHTLEESAEEGDYASASMELAAQDGIRVTVIRPDGSVAYDNQTDASKMENHSDRPEVQKAVSQGEGIEVRRSDTMDKSTFYYAMQMENGAILRVARETGSIWSILMQAFPMMFLLAVVLIGISVLLSSVLTRSIVKPIETLANDLGSVEAVVTYKELMPFVRTIRKQHEDILKSAQIRQEFTANVSHELKTPLTSISGYSELIENGMATGNDMQRFAGEIHKNAQRLLTLINDILRLSELDVSDSETMTPEPVDLYAAAENCVSMLSLSAEKHGVHVDLQGKGCVIEGNRQMLEELIYNLCDNAIRYNHQGGSVRVSIEELPATGQARLVVQDTGIGIPAEHQARVFERFYRVDKSRSKSTGGTGLGLAIVKHIVSRHQAEMQLESEAGTGTVITIVFYKNLRQREEA